MTLILIISVIFNGILVGSFLWCNYSWYKFSSKESDEWYKRCERVNKEWSQKYQKLLNQIENKKEV